MPARIGIDVGRKLPLEEAMTSAATNDVGIIDIQLDTGGNMVTSFDAPPIPRDPPLLRPPRD